MRRHSLELFISVGIVVATAAVFWNVLRAGFVAWDDDANVYENHLIRKLDGRHVAAMFLDVEQAMRYKPVSWLTWGTIYALSGLKPFAYHLANLLLHCGNAVLVFLTIRQLLHFSGGHGHSAGHRNRLLLCAGVGALLWAIHPLRVEPVAWATGLPYDLALLFVLVSFLCYLGVERADPQIKRILYWGSVLTFTLALLSYPIVLGFPLVLVVLDYYRSVQLNGGAARWWNRAGFRIWVEKIPFLLASGLFTGIAMYGRIRPEGRWAEAVTIEEFGVVSRAMQAFYIWAYFLWKPCFPTGLSPVYTTLLSFHPTDLPFVSSMALVVGLSFLVFWHGKKWPGACALWICHLVLLIPVLGLTEHPHFPSDRYGILAGILWPILIAAGLFRFSAGGRSKGLAVAASVVVLAALGWMSYRQTGIWRNSVALHEHMIERLGNHPGRVWLERAISDIFRTGLFRLGRVYLEERDDQQAANAFNQVLQLDPSSAEAHWNLGNIFYHRGATEEALRQYSAALHINPNDASTRLNAGAALATLGKMEEAKEQFFEAAQLEPQNANAHRSLARALTKLGRLDEAKVHEDEARRLDVQQPHSPP